MSMPKSSRFLKMQVEGVFFEAMRCGYAAREPVGKSRWGEPDLVGGKMYTHIRAPWRVEDRYVVGENGWSAGWTLILFEGQPVWQMSYDGYYENEAIPFLKAALRANYETSIFYGGRGPEVFTDPSWENLVYINGAPVSAFDKFSGIEGVRRRAGDQLAPLGFHRYSGGFLF